MWQITVKRLRCWAPWASAPGGPPIPVRPYCVLVGCLYPTGRLVKHDICNPPDAPPGCPRLLALLLSAMHNPAGEGVPAHRPGKVTFTDAALAGGCAKSLSALGVETSVLSEAAGFPDYVRGLSKALCMKGSAAVSAACDRPGLLASGSVSEPLARAFFLLADEFARKQPWMRMWERQTVRILLKSHLPGRWAVKDSFNTLDIARLGDMLARIKGRIVTRRLDRVSPLAVPALLEIAKEMVAGAGAEDILPENEDALIRDAMRVD